MKGLEYLKYLTEHVTSSYLIPHKTDEDSVRDNQPTIHHYNKFFGMVPFAIKILLQKKKSR